MLFLNVFSRFFACRFLCGFLCRNVLFYEEGEQLFVHDRVDDIVDLLFVQRFLELFDGLRSVACKLLDLFVDVLVLDVDVFGFDKRFHDKTHFDGLCCLIFVLIFELLSGHVEIFEIIVKLQTLIHKTIFKLVHHVFRFVIYHCLRNFNR